MRPLPTTYHKNGFDYKLVQRIADVCIYEQRDGDRVVAYEVFEVNKNEEREMAGKIIPASESVPNANQWGKFAYSVHTIEQAHTRAQQLLAKIEERRERVH